MTKHERAQALVVLAGHALTGILSAPDLVNAIKEHYEGIKFSEAVAEEASLYAAATLARLEKKKSAPKKFPVNPKAN